MMRLPLPIIQTIQKIQQRVIIYHIPTISITRQLLLQVRWLLKEWKLPNNTEWEKLKNYIRNETAVLKAAVWTTFEDVPSHNKTV